MMVVLLVVMMVIVKKMLIGKSKYVCPGRGEAVGPAL